MSDQDRSSSIRQRSPDDVGYSGTTSRGPERARSRDGLIPGKTDSQSPRLTMDQEQRGRTYQTPHANRPKQPSVKPQSLCYRASPRPDSLPPAKMPVRNPPNRSSHSPAALASRRETSAPVHPLSRRSYSTDNLDEFLIDFKSLHHIHAVQKRVYFHKFPGSLREESKFFQDARWANEDIIYALEVVENCIATIDAAEKVDLNSFPEPDDADIEELPFPEELRYLDILALPVDHMTSMYIVLLAKLRIQILSLTRTDVRHFMPEFRRHEMLREWIDSPKRLHYKLPRTPVKMLQPQFTRDDLNYAALYAKNKRLDFWRSYEDLWNTIEDDPELLKSVRAAGCKSLEELDWLGRKHQDMVDFDLIPDYDLLTYRWDADDSFIDIGQGKKLPVLSYSDDVLPYLDECIDCDHEDARLDFEDAKRDNEDGKIVQLNWRWSIAEFAKHACIFKVQWNKLDNAHRRALGKDDRPHVETIAPPTRRSTPSSIEPWIRNKANNRLELIAYRSDPHRK